MRVLDIGRLQITSPYAVVKQGDEYLFRTDSDILYAVSFQPYDGISGITAYWFDLSNRSHLPSPNDKIVRETIICMIEEFFHQNPDILLYMCDNANDQQSQRARLFLRWFNGAEQKKKYDIRTALLTEDGIDSYIALIIQRSHPQYDDILYVFDTEIALFNEQKP